ncbi:MAG: DNA-binding response regulator [Spirochaetaceae bacterium]|nr:MAG: DNA-binding response regulator [Spirochaetaceae bacterium]
MAAGRKILVVDDDRKTVRLIRLYLEQDGFRVICAYDGPSALRLARDTHPEVIVLDLMLPGISGVEVCRTLRAESEAAIIMLTARVALEDRVGGLEAGADDYVVKPFSPRELLARVRAVVRRLPAEAVFRGPDEVSCGELTLNFQRHEVRLGSRLLDITPVEFRLLGAMIREPRRVFDREQLVQRVFGYDYEGLQRTIDVHIRNLRRKIEDDPARPVYIKTVYGVGYTFAPEAA